MSQPVNKRKKAQRMKVTSLLTGAGIFYAFLHFPKCWDGTPESVERLVMHMFKEPLDIFPVDSKYVGTGLIVALVTMLLMYQHYLNNINLRPGEESGSAKWNDNLKKYYKKYADVSFKYQLPKPKGKDAVSKTIRGIIEKLEMLLFGWSMKLNTDTGGKNTWTQVTGKNGEPAYIHKGTKNMILSQDVVLSMNTRKTMRNNNILVIGGSGTGKSRFMIKPNMLQANSSFIITDPSGELLESMGTFLEEKGYEVRVFNLSQMEHSNCYNPFHYIRNQEGVLSMINALIKNTTPKGASSNDPFWEKAETALLQAICFFLVAECNPDEQNFSSVMKLLRCVDAGEGSEDRASVLDILMDELREKDPEHIALRSYAVFKSAGGGKTAQSILISCQTRLQMFNLHAISNLTNTDNIDLKSVGDRPTALFCVTKVEDTTFNFLVALLYTQLFETLYDHARNECPGLRLPIHVRFLLDEFANIGTIPEFNEKLATMRKHEISCTIVIQALSQLKTMYKDDWEVIVGNCDTLLFLGGSDATTLDYISKKLGKETIRAKNTSRTYGRTGSSSTSFNSTGRELMQPDEISAMDNMNCIIFIRGEAPFFSVKYDYPKHPNYDMTGDAHDEKLFNIQQNIQTVANVPDVGFEQKQINQIKDTIEDSKDLSAEMKRRQQQLKNIQRKYYQNRNAALRQQEQSAAENMDLSVGSIDEFVEKNGYDHSAEELESMIERRYEFEEVYSVPDEYEDDEFSSPMLKE